MPALTSRNSSLAFADAGPVPACGRALRGPNGGASGSLLGQVGMVFIR
jgi:hypothetical protein